jgi:carboxymethylenebutenolidase
MVAEPYVNHVPVMTGGVGQQDLARFYAQHFIPKLPADTRLVPISRIVGGDRVVDEMLFCFTHDVEIDWMLPGVPPTGRYVEVPLVAIVNFRGDKLYHEHIYWDQASVLVQIGLIDPAGLPVAGIETAKKLRRDAPLEHADDPLDRERGKDSGLVVAVVIPGAAR